MPVEAFGLGKQKESISHSGGSYDVERVGLG